MMPLDEGSRKKILTMRRMTKTNLMNSDPEDQVLSSGFALAVVNRVSGVVLHHCDKPALDIGLPST